LESVAPVSLKLRRAAPEDLPSLTEIHAQVQELHRRARPDHFREVETSVLEARLRELLTHPDTSVWVAELSGAVVGYLVSIWQLRAANSFCVEQRWCLLDQVGVHEDFRSRGIGSALLRAAIDEARSAGIEQIELSSWAFNRAAHRAFERAGFIPKTLRFELRDGSARDANPGAAAGEPER
jgi:ribosomal protein S18 acetylase RimI-like enzyme